MTYTAVGSAKYSQQIAKEIACDNHLRKYDVTKHDKDKQINTCVNK